MVLVTSALALMDAQIIIVLAGQLWRSKGTGYLVMNIVLMVYCGLFTLFVLSLIFMHSFLVSENMTTYELCKKHWNIASGNPFKKSNFLKNFIRMCYTGTNKHPLSNPYEPVIPKSFEEP